MSSCGFVLADTVLVARTDSSRAGWQDHRGGEEFDKLENIEVAWQTPMAAKIYRIECMQQLPDLHIGLLSYPSVDQYW